MRKRTASLLSLLAIGLAACDAASATPSTIPPVSEQPTTAAASSVLATAIPTSVHIPTAVPSPTYQLLLFSDDQLKAQVDGLARKFMTESGNPGLSVAIVIRNPQLDQLQVMLLNYGITSKDNGQPISSDTEYEIASVTKVFTGILLAKAIEGGTVGLDDPIQNYLPSGIHAPMFHGIPIRIVDLATHRSGLPRDITSDDPRNLYLYLNRIKLHNAPGSEYQYSNFGYELLGDILARLAGRGYGSLESEFLSTPLGLIDTTETLSTDQRNRLAQGYQYYGSPAPFFPETGAMGPAAYLHSTIKDMARFLVANMRPDATTLGPMLKLARTSAAEGSNPDSGAGLGWDILHLDSPKARIWKDGASAGFSSYVSFAQDGSSGFVLLTNGHLIDNLATDMIQLLGE